MKKDLQIVEEAEPPGAQINEEDQIVEPPHFRHAIKNNAGLSVVRSHRQRPFNELPANPRSIAFKEQYFPEATNAQWHDWRWQITHRFTERKQLEEILTLSDREREAFSKSVPFPMSVTPYYASLLDADDPEQPLRRCVIPTVDERRLSFGESDDPLHEDEDSPVSGIVHRYPDRVLFLVTNFCSTYCRYCTRSRTVGKALGRRTRLEAWEKAAAYVESNTDVRDVLISGGDPLTLPDNSLEWLLTRLRRIPHVEIIRIGTKAPVVLPQRITSSLVRMLKRFHPLWINIHFTHPEELTPETVAACNRLVDAGIPLGSQTVLLKGINDDVETMKNLMHGLLKTRVRPYYLYQCDPIRGSAHFKTTVEKGLEIIKGLRGHTTGFAVPNYVIDSPGGGGKVPLLYETMVGRDGDDLLLRNYEGGIYRYPDPPTRDNA